MKMFCVPCCYLKKYILAFIARFHLFYLNQSRWKKRFFMLMAVILSCSYLARKFVSHIPSQDFTDFLFSYVSQMNNNEPLPATNLSCKAKHPVIILPGLASINLELWHSEEDFIFRQPVWGTLDMIYQFMTNNTQFIKNLLIDEKKRKVRPATGLSSCDYILPFYWVWQKILANLGHVGYDIKNLHIASYDWRLDCQSLESRDAYFTRLMHEIEMFHAINKEKVVLIAHSMGGILAMYFMNWVSEHRPIFIDQHVHAVIAIATPFLGASKSISGLLSGEAKTSSSFFESTLQEYMFNRESRKLLLNNWPSIKTFLPSKNVWLNTLFVEGHEIDNTLLVLALKKSEKEAVKLIFDILKNKKSEESDTKKNMKEKPVQLKEERKHEAATKDESEIQEMIKKEIESKQERYKNKTEFDNEKVIMETCNDCHEEMEYFEMNEHETAIGSKGSKFLIDQKGKCKLVEKKTKLKLITKYVLQRIYQFHIFLSILSKSIKNKITDFVCIFFDKIIFSQSNNITVLLTQTYEGFIKAIERSCTNYKALKPQFHLLYTYLTKLYLARKFVVKKNKTDYTDPFQYKLPAANNLKIYSLYGIGKETERGYYYTIKNGELTIDKKVNMKIEEGSEHIFKNINVKHGVIYTDGDGTVPRFSAGYIPYRFWKKGNNNKHNVETITKEYQHEAQTGCIRGGKKTTEHIDILGNFEMTTDVIRICCGEKLEDRTYNFSSVCDEIDNIIEEKKKSKECDTNANFNKKMEN